MTSTLYSGIGELTTNDPTLGDGTALGRLLDAALVAEDGRVAWVGPADRAPACDEEVQCAGAAVVPGFVDSHTHLVFAGERSGEFEARMAGEEYDGGGILTTVAATRAAADADLSAAALRRRRAMWRQGTTTVEAKSGYALDVEGEERLLRISGRHAQATTYLGAHVVPPGYAHDRDGYVALVAGAMLAACAPHAQWADVFCDRGAFSVDEARHVLGAAAAAGLGLRLHGHQIEATGAVALAVEVGAASVDHCTLLSATDIEALAASGTVATLLPTAELLTRSAPAPARALLDAGATVALATDCNPGTSYVTSMPLVVALAVSRLGLTCDEALWAATRGGAAALRRDDVGHLGVGAHADLVVLDAPRAAHLAYRPGDPVVDRVVGDPTRTVVPSGPNRWPLT